VHLNIFSPRTKVKLFRWFILDATSLFFYATQKEMMSLSFSKASKATYVITRPLKSNGYLLKDRKFCMDNTKRSFHYSSLEWWKLFNVSLYYCFILFFFYLFSLLEAT